MEQRISPSDKGAEQAVLGCILLENSSFDTAFSILRKPTFFYDTVNQRLWNIIIQMINEGKPIDYITLINELTPEDKANGADTYYITGLTNSAPSPANIAYYADIIAEKYFKRCFIETSHVIQDCATNDALDTVIAKMHSYSEIIDQMSKKKDESIKDIAAEAIRNIKEPNNLIKWGIASIDTMAGGLTKGEVSIIAGRPGHGKTTFVLNLIPRFVEQGLKVMMVNREMTNTEMMKKLLTLESNKLSYRKVRLCELSLEDQMELSRAQKIVTDKYEGKLIMYDSLRDLTSVIIEARKHKPDVIIDDYLQLIRIPGGKDRRFEIEEIMQEYKWLCKQNNIAAILCSQLNRELERRQDPIPRLSDLSEGGSIEQVAENVLFTYYEYKVKMNYSKLGKFAIQLFASKVRYGETGQCVLGFNGDKCKFYNTKEDVVLSP